MKTDLIAEFDMTLSLLSLFSCFNCSERRIELTPILFFKDLVAAMPNEYLLESNCLEI